MANPKKTKRNPTSTTDPVTAYANAVVKGDTVAGPHVRDACRRHLSDLATGSARGLTFDLKAVAHALGYFESVLCLNGGEYEGKAFTLLPWQAFIVGSLFGWKRPDGTRRFRVAYVETGKGSGKSPLAAGIGLFGLTADGESRAEVYAAATKKDQAMVLFRDAVAMRDLSPQLSKRLKKSGVGANAWNLAYPTTASFFRCLAADDNQSGPRPHISLLDEIHEHRNANVVEMLRAGQKSRRQPLMVMITNAGTDPHSVCWDYHAYGTQVAARSREDDSFFAYVCALDESDDPFKSEECWPKANPSLLAGLPGYTYLREQVTQARGMPGKESITRRLNFCQWVEALTPWISAQAWLACGADAADFDEAELFNRRCWGGLDLSSTTDLTSLALLFEPTDEDPYCRLRIWFWVPGDGLTEKSERDRVPYIVWRERGAVIATPGKVVDKAIVLQTLVQLAERFEIQDIGYDRWRIEDVKALAERESLDVPTLIEFGQGFKDMGPAVDQFEELIVAGTLRHDANPCLTWNAANAVVVSDPAGNRKVSKAKAIGRVDGIVAAVMAAGRAAGQSADGVSFWDKSDAVTEPANGAVDA